MINGIGTGGDINNYNINRGEKNNNELANNVDISLKNRVENKNPSGEKAKKSEGIRECQTCKNRRYQDGSNDPGVSFKSPTKMSPSQAASAVAGHEREHVSRNNSKAAQEGREVIDSSVRIFTDVCPECGKTYVSGGETKTTTKKKETQAQFAKDFFEAKVGNSRPKVVDAGV